jgi:serine/alanine adding enzyme
MRILDTLNKESWRKFNSIHPQGNIFQTPEMFDVYKKTKNIEPVLIAVEDNIGDLVGILVAVIQKEHSGLLGNFSARSIIDGGPLVKDNSVNVLDFILKEYIKKIEDKAIYSLFRNFWKWSESERLIFHGNGFKFQDHLNILIDLREPEDILISKMHSGRRKNIRRAEKIPLQFTETDNKDDFYCCLSLIEQTYKRVNLPCPDRSLFLNAKEILASQDKAKFFLAKFENKIINCRFELCFKDIIYDWYAGSDDNYLDKYPNDFLPWKIFQWAKMNNYNTFDFGGAGKPNKPYGVRDYKLKFGGELINYGRFELVHKKLLMQTGKIGLALFNKMKKLYGKILL